MTLTIAGMQARKSSALKCKVPNPQVIADPSWETCKQFSALNIDSEVFGMLLSRSLALLILMAGCLAYIRTPLSKSFVYISGSLQVRKVLICHASVGSGHSRAAQAVWAEDCREIVFELVKKNCRFRITKAGSMGIQ